MHAPASLKPKLLPIRVLLQFATVTMIWGSTWLVIRTQLGVVPPSWSVAYRFLIAGSMMLAYCLATGRPLRFPPAAHGFFLLLALTQFVFNFNLVYRAEQHVTSGLVAVAFALLVVFNVGLAWLFLRQTISLRFAGGAGLGIVGVALLFWREMGTLAQVTGPVGYGLLLTLLGVLSAAFANVMQATERGRSYDVFGTLAWAMLYGGLIDAAIAWGISGPPVIAPTPIYIGGVLYLAIVASAIAFTIYYDMIRAIGPARAAYSSVVIPVIAMTLSALFEDYRLSPLAFVGAGLTLAGLFTALRARQR